MALTKFNHGAFMLELRARRGTVPADLYRDLMAALEAGLGAAPPPSVDSDGEPAWLIEARKHMGLKEIPGQRHNPTIMGWIKALGGWFTSDEVAWCGTFTAICMKTAGIAPPDPHWYRAKDWADWGIACKPRIGAVVVFGRTGGGHVGFLVGESASNFYVLGGNQSNAVNIMPIAKSRMVPNGIRWPSSVPLNKAGLPKMSGGTVSTNEA